MSIGIFDTGLQEVELTCRAEVRGVQVYVTQRVLGMVYDDPVAREVIEQNLHRALMDKILERWKPRIIVDR